MADLDSFFAKKDKKKLKGKNFTSTDEIARRLEETEKKLEKDFQKEAPLPKPAPIVVEEVTEETPGVVRTVVVNEVKSTKKEEEEWNDFKDEGNEDLTDLKIGRLHVEDEDEYSGGGGGGEENQDGEGSDKKDGVWKKEKQVMPVEQVIAQIEESAATSSSSSTPSTYVPPHLRNNPAPSPLSRGVKSGKKNKTAPDITNEMAFPSLSNAQAANPGGAWGKRNFDERSGFENVKHGSMRSNQNEFSSPKLSTANRYDALTDHS